MRSTSPGGNPNESGSSPKGPSAKDPQNYTLTQKSRRKRFREWLHHHRGEASPPSRGDESILIDVGDEYLNSQNGLSFIPVFSADEAEGWKSNTPQRRSSKKLRELLRHCMKRRHMGDDGFAKDANFVLKSQRRKDAEQTASSSEEDNRKIFNETSVEGLAEDGTDLVDDSAVNGYASYCLKRPQETFDPVFESNKKLHFESVDHNSPLMAKSSPCETDVHNEEVDEVIEEPNFTSSSVYSSEKSFDRTICRGSLRVSEYDYNVAGPRSNMLDFKNVNSEPCVPEHDYDDDLYGNPYIDSDCFDNNLNSLLIPTFRQSAEWGVTKIVENVNNGTISNQDLLEVANAGAVNLDFRDKEFFDTAVNLDKVRNDQTILNSGIKFDKFSHLLVYDAGTGCEKNVKIVSPENESRSQPRSCTTLSSKPGKPILKNRVNTKAVEESFRAKTCDEIDVFSFLRFFRNHEMERREDEVQVGKIRDLQLLHYYSTNLNARSAKIDLELYKSKLATELNIGRSLPRDLKKKASPPFVKRKSDDKRFAKIQICH
ncbi:LAMI_0C05952g1_1 [Lachancea mirantina]|uniref:LAMI_0C05952g1_1 n=1 Tax=Lachancea mirantina TaxID=1230905 RepID=A0A1G4J2Z1_9SACH|nr:LAMI_0C05952g1_1 [Lachancea mirantina]